MGMLEMIQSGRENRPPRIMIYGSEGVGKAQPLNAKVLTPTGWTEIGKLKIGSEIIGQDGKTHHVIGVFPRGQKDVFKVTCRDGASTECCDEHLWFTQTRTERDHGLPGAVRDLKSIRSTLRYGTHFNHAIPRVEPVQFSASKKLPIDPWLLGIYLAEGNSESSAKITNPEQDIQRRISESLSENDTVVFYEKAVRIRKKKFGNCPSDFLAALREFGLDKKISDTKFIPECYLLASIDDRTELLRGLIDGDGYVHQPGAVEICTASPQMAKDIIFLARSLGGSAKMTVRKGKYINSRKERCQVKPSHRIYLSFTNGIIPVASEKHTAKWKQPEWMIRNTIRSVEPVGKKECVCIMVDAPDELYVTDDFIVTHNSTFGASAPNPIFIQTEDGLGELDCHKFPLAHSLSEVLAQLTALRDEQHDFQTVVVDSADWLERLIFDEVCREYGVRSIEKADGGYGKGYTHALTHWRKVVNLLQELRDKRGMMVILVAHAKVERFEDPENAAYDRYTPRLNKHAASLIAEWVDAVLFANKKFRVSKDSNDRAIAAPIGADGGERIIRTVGSPACIAKNRYGLPGEIPLSWAAFINAYQKALEKNHGKVQ